MYVYIYIMQRWWEYNLQTECSSEWIQRILSVLCIIFVRCAMIASIKIYSEATRLLCESYIAKKGVKHADFSWQEELERISGNERLYWGDLLSFIRKYLLTPANFWKLKQYLTQIEKLQSVTLALQRDGTNLYQARQLFDILEQGSQALHPYLSLNASIVASAIFVKVVWLKFKGTMKESWQWEKSS